LTAFVLNGNVRTFCHMYDVKPGPGPTFFSIHVTQSHHRNGNVCRPVLCREVSSFHQLDRPFRFSIGTAGTVSGSCATEHTSKTNAKSIIHHPTNVSFASNLTFTGHGDSFIRMNVCYCRELNHQDSSKFLPRTAATYQIPGTIAIDASAKGPPSDTARRRAVLYGPGGIRSRGRGRVVDKRDS
jgi:hypothetical protein